MDHDKNIEKDNGNIPLNIKWKNTKKMIMAIFPLTSNNNSSKPNIKR